MPSDIVRPLPGEKGDQGFKGDKGEPGSDGRNGLQGLPGIVGMKGDKGVLVSIQPKDFQSYNGMFRVCLVIPVNLANKDCLVCQDSKE